MNEIVNSKLDAKVSAIINNEAKPYVPVSDNMKTAWKEDNLVDDPGDLYDDKTNKKEAKEIHGLPQLEAENHKIDKWKSKKEKLAEWWKEEEAPVLLSGDGTETKIKVLKKQIGKGAFVREYQDDGKIPKQLVGEQFFNWKAILALWLKDRLPTFNGISELIKMQAQNFWDNFDVCYKSFLKNNFQKNWKNLIHGWWSSSIDAFYVDKGSAYCWLADGNYAVFDKNDVATYNDGPEMGFSLRLLKK